MHDRLAALYAELATEHRRLAKAEREDFVDQVHSPLGRRLHVRLVRRGVLAGYQVGKRVLVRRADLDRYIEEHRITPTDPRAASAEVDQHAQKLLAKFGGKAA